MRAAVCFQTASPQKCLKTNATVEPLLLVYQAIARKLAGKEPHSHIRPAAARPGMPLALAPNVTLSTVPVEAQPSVTVRRSDDSGVAIVSVPASGVDLEAVERALIVFALDATSGNRTRAARLLRVTRSALLYRLQKYGLTVKQGSS